MTEAVSIVVSISLAFNADTTLVLVKDEQGNPFEVAGMTVKVKPILPTSSKQVTMQRDTSRGKGWFYTNATFPKGTKTVLVTVEVPGGQGDESHSETQRKEYRATMVFQLEQSFDYTVVPRYKSYCRLVTVWDPCCCQWVCCYVPYCVVPTPVCVAPAREWQVVCRDRLCNLNPVVTRRSTLARLKARIPVAPIKFERSQINREGDRISTTVTRHRVPIQRTHQSQSVAQLAP